MVYFYYSIMFSLWCESCYNHETIINILWLGEKKWNKWSIRSRDNTSAINKYTIFMNWFDRKFSERSIFKIFWCVPVWNFLICSTRITSTVSANLYTMIFKSALQLLMNSRITNKKKQNKFGFNWHLFFCCVYIMFIRLSRVNKNSIC